MDNIPSLEALGKQPYPSKLPRLFHVSVMDIAGTILTPRVPKNEFVDWGVEDNKTKRVCFARSITKCLLALGYDLKDKVFNVYVPDTTYTPVDTLLKNIHFPTKDEVPDVAFSHEVWVTCPVKLKYHSRIRVLDVIRDYHFELTDKNGKVHQCRDKDWNYEVIPDKVPQCVTDCKKIFDKIKYGLRDPKTGRPWEEQHSSTTMQDDYEVWRLATEQETVKSGVGICYDTTLIGRNRLSRGNLKFGTYFMSLVHDAENNPCHTFNIYLNPFDWEWKWLEGSWAPFKNNTWSSKDETAILDWIGTAMANMEHADVCIRKMVNYPKPGVDMHTFEKFCWSCKPVMISKPEGSNKK